MTYRRLLHKLHRYRHYIAAFSSPVIVLTLAYFSRESDPALAIATISNATVPVNRIPVATQLKGFQGERGARQSVLDCIAEYQSSYDSDPRGEDAPAYLMAIGTMQMEKLSDCQSAVSIFELILSEYPHAIQRTPAYYQALACYQRLGDEMGSRTLLRQMRDEFSDDTAEYRFADAMLTNGVP